MKLFINLCFLSSLQSATNCSYTEEQIQKNARGSAHTACVAQQCLYENYPQMMEKEQHPSNKVKDEAILKSSSEAQNDFWIKSHTEDIGQFSARPINKALQSIRNSLTEFM